MKAHSASAGENEYLINYIIFFRPEVPSSGSAAHDSDSTEKEIVVPRLLIKGRPA
jgi:hypothetical protein